jgi:hypothetical protein
MVLAKLFPNLNYDSSDEDDDVERRIVSTKRMFAQVKEEYSTVVKEEVTGDEAPVVESSRTPIQSTPVNNLLFEEDVIVRRSEDTVTLSELVERMESSTAMIVLSDVVEGIHKQYSGLWVYCMNVLVVLVRVHLDAPSPSPSRSKHINSFRTEIMLISNKFKYAPATIQLTVDKYNELSPDHKITMKSFLEGLYFVPQLAKATIFSLIGERQDPAIINFIEQEDDLAALRTNYLTPQKAILYWNTMEEIMNSDYNGMLSQLSIIQTNTMIAMEDRIRFLESTMLDILTRAEQKDKELAHITAYIEAEQRKRKFEWSYKTAEDFPNWMRDSTRRKTTTKRSEIDVSLPLEEYQEAHTEDASPQVTSEQLAQLVDQDGGIVVSFDESVALTTVGDLLYAQQ